MGARPRLAVIVYGSLLAPTALEDIFGDPTERVWPIRLHGYERICNQTASWRGTEANQQAVLNVCRAEDTWCNGLVVTNLQRDEFKTFRDRERGYLLIEVQSDHIDPYPSTEISRPFDTSKPSLNDQDLLLVTTGQHVDHDIDPIPNYLEECLYRASQWGEQFLADFKMTTATNAAKDLTATRSDRE